MWAEVQEDDGDASAGTEVDDYEQDIAGTGTDEEDMIGSSSDEEDDSLTPPQLKKRVWPRGMLTRAAVLDLLAEQANFHGVSDAMMEGVLDIVNMLVLDGGAKTPVLSSWDAFKKMVDRRTAHVTSTYLLCPHGCRGGAMRLNSLNVRALPRTCSSCRGDIELDQKSLPQYVLRHFSVEEQLRSILQHPGNFCRGTVLVLAECSASCCFRAFAPMLENF